MVMLALGLLMPLGHLQHLLQQVLKDIATLGTPGKPAQIAAGTLDANQLREHLEGLKQALNYDLGSAEKILGQLLAGVSGTPLQVDVAAIASKVDMFEIDAAQTLLTQLQHRLKSSN